MNRTLKAALALALVGALALSAGCTTKVITAPSGGTQLGTVTATGSGSVPATPDQATMSFGVTAQDANAKTALDKASKTAKAISDALVKTGVAEKDIQTQNVSVYPITDNKQTITGYTSSLSVRAKVRDLGKLSDVINAATKAGASDISGPEFTVSEDSDYRDKAIEKAVADARRSAEAMAKAAGKSVGGVVSMTVADANVGAMPMASGYNSRDAATAVPISAGQLDIGASVTVVFELK